MKQIILFSISISLSFLFGCSGQINGPANDPDFEYILGRALPPETGEIVLSGPGTWCPHRTGILGGGHCEVGMLVVTDDSMLVLKWLPDNEKYLVVKLFSLNELSEVYLEPFSIDRLVVVSWKDISVDGFWFRNAMNSIDIKDTEQLYDVLRVNLDTSQ
jgi:hypothetical protein